jgi:hypothetical protein
MADATQNSFVGMINPRDLILSLQVRSGTRQDTAFNFNDATNALDQCDRDHRLCAGGRPTLPVYRVVCTDEEALNWKVDDIGNLRVALNALVRVFRM